MTGPDAPTFLSTYAMAPLTDYEEQTLTVNGLRSSSITEISRVACYNQTVYCDTRLELTEYFGLGIAVRELSTVGTNVDPIYGQTAVKILVSRNSKCIVSHMILLYLATFIVIISGAEVCLENTVYHGAESMMEVCAIITHPEINCPIQFPFNVTLSTRGGKVF